MAATRTAINAYPFFYQSAPHWQCSALRISNTIQCAYESLLQFWEEVLSIDWNFVTVDHVREACELFDTGDICPKRAARSTFLHLDNRIYPAKFVRGHAYFLATGVKLDPSREYSGGLETVRFFSKLGLRTSSGDRPANEVSTPLPTTIRKSVSHSSMLKRKYEPQKQALLEILKERFGTVTCESTFPWLKVPDRNDLDGPLVQILQALEVMRGHSNFLNSGHRLHCDFVVPHERIIVEYDERQHFTVQRKKSLEFYPSDIELGFDKNEWMVSCAAIHATDPSPKYRDEQRAFYDALRDIYAVCNGYKIIRIRQGVVDWTSDRALAALETIFPPRIVRTTTVAPKIPNSDAAKLQRIAVIAHDYKVPDSRGLYDYSEHFSKINQVCDAHGCDTILYALYTWDQASPTNRTHTVIFDGLANVQRIVLEVGQAPTTFDACRRVELWTKQNSLPEFAVQKFAKSKAKDDFKRNFIQELPSRLVSNGLLVLCGETNITSLTRSTDTFRDPFNFVEKLQKLDINVLLNPIHDYMRRPEMRKKREFYSRNGRTVVSVWNKGKGREAELPWTLFHDGKDRTTEQIKEIQRPFRERPDIRIGILDLSHL